MRIRASFETLAQDVRFALRSVWKNPGFGIIAIVTVGLGIGAVTAIFNVVNIFLIRPLPYPEAQRLVGLFERNVIGDEPLMSVAPGNFLDWQKTATSFEQMAAYGFQILTVSNSNGGAASERVGVCNCSGNLFATLGVSPIVGRAFTADDDRFGAPPLAIISYGLWQRQYGGTDVIGKTVRINGADSEIVGVMPRSFMFPSRIVDVWTPFLTGLPPQQQIRHDLHYLSVVARLRAGVSPEQGRAEIDGIAARYKSAHPDEATGKGANILSLHDQLIGGPDARTPFLVLLAAVACVLLVACVNVAGLLLTRAMSRTREIGIRAALGAGRGRILRQLVTESVILALGGGALGVLLTYSITNYLVEHAPGATRLVPADNSPVDLRVFLFAAVVATLSGIMVGVVPAIRVSRFALTNDLKSGGRSVTAGRSHALLRNGLVAVEISLSVVLLTGSGLLLRSFFLLNEVRPGVRVDQTLTMNLSAPSAKYPRADQRSMLLSKIGERLRALPGVRSVGLTSCPAVSGACNVLFYYVDGRPFVLGKVLTAMERSVDPDYFIAAGIPLVRGRTFTTRDGIGFDLTQPRLGSIVISESMAKAIFPGDDPLGKQIFFDFEVQRNRIQGTPVPHYEVIGVVADVLSSLDAKASPTLYRPLLDVANSGATVVLHTVVEPKSVTASARNEIRAIDSELAVSRIQTMNELLTASTTSQQFNMVLFLAFAGLALLLAAIGLYGLVSYGVSQRRSEIGIRLTLGATSSDVNKMIFFQGLKPAILGVVVGTVGSAFATQILRSQLFGITPLDPITFVIVPILLLAVAALACFPPTLRATRVDPVASLRAE